MNSFMVFAEEETAEDAYNAGYAMGMMEAQTRDNLPSDLEIRSKYSGSFPGYFVDGYKDGFMIAKETYGTRMGKLIGAIYGARDCKNGQDSDWRTALPSDEDIISMFNLDSETDGYTNRFLMDFKIAFEEAYKEAYESANLDPTVSSAEAGNRDGTAVGSSLGELFGKKDFEAGLTNDYTRRIPTDDQIIEDYELNKDNEEYREAFLVSFKIAFELNYERAYREANLGDKETEAERLGYDYGFEDGKDIARENMEKGTLLPIDLVRLTDDEVMAKYSTQLAGKNEVYIDRFLQGYQVGFEDGYNTANTSNAEYLDGYNRGYNYGKALAAKNNAENNYLPYESVKMTDYQVMGNNYEYLKDKSSEFILNFVAGYQDGFEKGYKEVIKRGPDEEDVVAISGGFGAAFGMTYGEMAGIRDYERGVSPNWTRAIPKDSEITAIFDLRKLPSIERNEFLDQFRINFQIGYEKAYYNAHFGTVRDNMNAGHADGQLFGSNLGAIYGAKDFYENRTSDYKRDMPSDFAITTEYALKRDNEQYAEGFLVGFKKAYQEAYINSFREANLNAKLMDESQAYGNGMEVGMIKGSFQANMDYMERKTNDWQRSQPMSSTIIFEYNLMYQTQKYRDGFISGFWDGYIRGYTDTFKSLAQQDAVNKTITVNVPISGGIINSLDRGFSVTIDKGIYYKPILVTIDTMTSMYLPSSTRYISASNLYRTSIINTNGALDNNKDIELRFEFYGDKNKAGIYKLVNNVWMYIPSKVEDGFIKANVKPKSIDSTGTIYAVLIDKDAPLLPDVRGHWAKDEINTLVRRNIIYGYTDNTFKPERNITRAEFLTLLSRVYNWYLPTYTGNTVLFKDFNEFGSRNSIISYALSAGYIKGYEDGYFRPNNPITYKEVEIIMQRVLNDSTFRWYNTSAKMLYEKNVRCRSYDDMNNKITRAEVSYMLYILNEWRY